MLQRLGFVRHEWRKKFAEWKFSAGKLGCLATHPVGRGGVVARLATCSVGCARAAAPVRSRAEKKRVIKWLFAHNTAFETVFQ
jgi:hypothetical protein